MFNYYSSNIALKTELNNKRGNLESVYNIIFGREGLNKIKRLEEELLTEKAFSQTNMPSIRYPLEVKYEGSNPIKGLKEVTIAPLISLPNKIKSIKTYLHEWNHFAFFALQKVPSAVITDIICHYCFPNTSFYKFIQMKKPRGVDRKGKKRENYLLAKIAGMLTLLEEHEGDLVMEKAEKIIKNPLYYFEDNHRQFRQGLNTLDWLLTWEKSNKRFMEVLNLTFGDDKELMKMFEKDKVFVYNFLESIGNIKFKKVNIIDYEKP